jgi:hypothetical protein
MNIQPILLLAAIALFVVGVVPLLRLLWIGSAVILLAMFVYFVYSAVKISAKYNDWSAMRLLVLYYVRSAAWFFGAVTTTLRYIGRRN